MELTAFLNDLEQRIDPQVEEALEKEWLQFADGKCTQSVFVPSRPISAPSVDYPVMLINDAFENETWMVYQQLKLVSEELASGKGNLLNVRANYGTGIIPSMYGAEMFYLQKELDTLPCTKPLYDGEDAIRQLLEERKMDFTQGLAGKAFRFAQIYLDAIKDYPKIQRYVHMYLPDLQGPFPLVDSLWGGDIYIALFEEEDLVHEAMTFMTDVYLTFAKKWLAIFKPFDADHHVEWGLLHRGNAIIRNDAIMNISGDMYGEFVKPYDQRILNEIGGGVHFCGRGDHYIDEVGSMENLSCLNMSQPHLNDMAKIYAAIIDKGVPIIGMPEAEVKRATEAGVDLKGLVHCGASLAVWEKKEN